MTGYTLGVGNPPQRPSLARRLQPLVAGRQTRADMTVAIVLLTLSLVATLTNLVMALAALPTFRECAALACDAGGSFDAFAITFLASLLVGTNFGVRAVLNILNRRSAWGYSLLDLLVSGACLLGGFAWSSLV